MCLIERNGIVIAANETFASRLGLKVNECIGKDVFSFIPPEIVENRKKFINRVIENGQPEIFEDKRNNVYLHHSVWPVLDANGYVNRIVIYVTDVTKQKEAESALIDSEKNYRTIFDSATEAIFIYDPKNQKIIDLNSASLKMFGYDSKEELLDCKISDLSANSFSYTEEASQEFIRKTYEIGIQTFEWLAKSKDGSLFWIEISLNAVEISGKDTILAIGRDITERKEAEKALRESEEKYRAFIQYSDTPIFAFNPDGTYRIANEAFAKPFGLKASDIVGKTPYNFFTFEEAENRLALIRKIFKEGIKGEIEVKVKMDTGKIDYYLTMADPIKDATGKVLWVYCTSKNITERKEIEESLKRQSELRQLLMDLSLTYINLPLEQVEQTINNSLEVLGRFVNADRAYTFDFNPKTGLCTNTREWLQEGVSSQMDNLQNIPLAIEWVEAFSKGEVIYIPDVLALADGTSKEVLIAQDIKSLIAAPIIRGDICIGFIGFDSVNCHHSFSIGEIQLLKVFTQMLVNVIQRKQSEELLQKQNREIEAQYEEYMQLNEALRQTNYDLEIAKAKAEESDRLKTAFLQNVSHEIRTPLNGILGFSGLLSEEGISKEDIKDYTTIIQTSGHRLLDTVNNVLDISKIETGQIIIKNSPFSINSLLADLYSFFSPPANSKSIELSLIKGMDDSLSLIKSDEAKLNQVFSNLINNAIKFTPKGAIEFGYKIQDVFIICFVKDTGLGIPPEFQEKIFDRFTQADISITRGFEGAGLGLAICKGLVEALGGKIWLESEIDKGSTFYFTIPNSSVQETEANLDEKKEIKNNYSSEIILIVEDDWASFRYLSKVLSSSNFTLLHAENGERAIEHVKKSPEIKFVLMDIKMPIMDGFEATKQIKLLRPELPIIAQTAYAFSEERAKILAIGCDDYLSKPIEKNKLLKLIDKYLK